MIMKIAAQKAKEKKILEARELTFEAGRKILDSIDWILDLQLAENARKNCARGKPGQA